MSKANPLTAKQSRGGLITGIVVVAVLIAALATGVAVQYARAHGNVSAGGGGSEPAVITGPGTNGQGVTVGKSGAANKIELFLDFRCPHCKEFEDAAGPEIDKLVDDGTATLTYYPLAFVDPEVSPRAAEGFAAAAAAGKARGYADALYENFGKAWTDDQLIDLGKQLGITDAKFADGIRNSSYASWLESIGTTAQQRGVTGTPTVFVNGRLLSADQLTPDGIKAAVGAH
ncbi:MAG TPA: thioredoxin domain-containing protein [Kribbellaceae bacterium]|nr:thioredoxin domain-containing protein [Kribbellaceae bacterium]